MRHFFKLVRRADKGELSPMEFTKELFGDEVHWPEVVASWWIYVEDGGKKWQYKDFVEYIEQLLESEGYTPSDLEWQVATSCEERPDDL
jgi:hypothetical protein